MGFRGNCHKRQFRGGQRSHEQATIGVCRHPHGHCCQDHGHAMLREHQPPQVHIDVLQESCCCKQLLLVLKTEEIIRSRQSDKEGERSGIRAICGTSAIRPVSGQATRVCNNPACSSSSRYQFQSSLVEPCPEDTGGAA